MALACSLAPPSSVPAIEEALRIDLPEIEAGDTIELEADRLIYQRARSRAEATGDVRLGLRDVTLKADALVLDLESNFAWATGEIVVEHGPRRLLASALVLEIDGMYASVDEALLTIVDPRTDRLALKLGAARLERFRADLYAVRGMSFTTCDCPGDSPPSWSISARSARVNPDRGAWLFGTRFRVREVPVIPLPVFYLPLGERRSGLLTPSVGFSGRNGLHLSQPLFLALGPSFDLTLEAGWYTGQEGWIEGSPSRPGVRGPEQTLELRWAPTRRSRGLLVLSHIYDLNRDDPDPGAPIRASRASLRASHTTRFDDGGFGEAGRGAHASLNLLTDAALAADLRPTLEQAQRGYLRSTARAHATLGPSLSLEAGGRWLQDIRRTLLIEEGEPARVRPLFGEDAPPTPQLLPLLHAGLAPAPLVGSLAGRGDLRFSAWRGKVRGEPAPMHVRASGEISHPLSLGRVLSGRAAASVSGDGWRDGVGGGLLARLYPRLDASLQTGLERRFGDLAHRARPGVGWRAVPFVLGDGPDIPLDIFERPFPERGLQQAYFFLANELWVWDRRALDLMLRQGVDLRERSLSDLDALLEVAPPAMPHRLEASIGWDWERLRMSFAGARGRIVLDRGAALHARWLWVDPAAGTRLTAGLEELFASGALPAPPLQLAEATIHEGVIGVSAPRFRGLGLRYDLNLELVEEPRPPQHRLRASYVSACRCWSATVTATWPPGLRVPELTVGLELAGLGSAGGP